MHKQRWLDAAKAAGIEQLEIYEQKSRSTSIRLFEGSVDGYTISECNGFAIRGIYKGNMGICFLEQDDDALLEDTLCRIKENAEVITSRDEVEIYAGDSAYPQLQLRSCTWNAHPDAEKIGMVSSAGLIKSIAKKLHEHKAENIVVDPVMVATSGSKLISDDAIGTLKEYLFPMAAVLTPNIPETEVLSGMEVKSAEDMIAAAKQISETYHCAVLCKGGHQLNDANDLLYRDGSYRWFNGKRIDNPNTHGTGCTLSSAIASNLAKGYDLDTAVERAKAYISGALAAMLDLGHGSGPMDHGFDFRGKGFAEEQA